MGADRATKRVPNAQELLTIKDAAELLSVCEMTLRRWDAAGKFSAHRHPMNGYRLYRRDDLVRLRQQIERGIASPAAATGRP
jgi:excisionase family DNA binding protein